jgi:O-antigen/teichoic acid export membrane protein
MNHTHSEFRSIARVRSALANAAIYRAMSQAVGVVIYVLLVRIMTEYNYGVYQLFYSVPGVMGAVLSFGISDALHRYLPEYFARKDYALARHFIRWSLMLRLFVSILFLSTCLLLWDQIAPIFKIQDAKPYFYVFIAVAITHFQCRTLTLALGANLMQQWSSGLAAAFSLFKLVGYSVAYLTDVSLLAILIADLAAYLLWYACLRFAYHTRIPRPATDQKVRFSKDEKRRVMRYAFFYNFNDAGVFALRPMSDRLFIAAFLNPVAVGAYAFSTGFNAMVQKMTPVSFFHGVIQPLIFTLDYRTQKNRAREYFQFLVKINYLVQFPILVLVASVPAQIINVVFGGKFIEYQYLLVAAFAFPVSYGFQAPASIIAQLGERAGIILASKIFAVYNVVAVIILIPYFGVYGAIFATGTAQLFKTLFIWFFVRKVATFGGMGFFFLTQIALWTLCWFGVKRVTSGMGDWAGLATAIIMVGLAALIGLRFAHFNPKESNLIRKVSGVRATNLLTAAGIIRP